MKFNFSELNKEVKRNNKSHMKAVVERNERKLAEMKNAQRAHREAAVASGR